MNPATFLARAAAGAGARGGPARLARLLPRRELPARHQTRRRQGAQSHTRPIQEAAVEAHSAIDFSALTGRIRDWRSADVTLAGFHARRVGVRAAAASFARRA